MAQIQVDVLMPVGPGEQPWFDTAVASILGQIEVDMRLLVVLDQRRTTPPAGALLVDPRVDVLINDGVPGVAGALRYGLLHCHSEWVARQDADDISHPQRIAAQMLATVGDVCLVGSGAVTIRGDDTFEWSAEPLPRSASVPVLTRDLLRWNPIAHSTALINRECALRVGNYCTQADGLEDYDLWLRMAAQGSIVNVSEPLLAYRLHEGQRTRSRRSLQAYRRVATSAFRTGRSIGLSRSSVIRTHGYYVARQGLLKATHAWQSVQGGRSIVGRKGSES